MRLKCRFHPQAWQNDYAIQVDPQGETDFEVEWPAGKPIPQDDQYESDHLRLEDAVPEWIANWAGPFYVEILDR